MESFVEVESRIVAGVDSVDADRRDLPNGDFFRPRALLAGVPRVQGLKESVRVRGCETTAVK